MTENEQQLMMEDKPEKAEKMTSIILDYDSYLYSKRRVPNLSDLVRNFLTMMAKEDEEYQSRLKTGYYEKDEKKDSGLVVQSPETAELTQPHEKGQGSSDGESVKE